MTNSMGISALWRTSLQLQRLPELLQPGTLIPSIETVPLVARSPDSSCRRRPDPRDPRSSRSDADAGRRALRHWPQRGVVRHRPSAHEKSNLMTITSIITKPIMTPPKARGWMPRRSGLYPGLSRLRSISIRRRVAFFAPAPHTSSDDPCSTTRHWPGPTGTTDTLTITDCRPNLILPATYCCD